MSAETPTSRSPEPVRRRIDWGQVGILYVRELRAAFRERAIIINSILIPLFLYPFMMWAAFSGIVFVMGQTEGALSRVAVAEWPPAHPGLRRLLETDQKIQFVKPTPDRARAERQIREGKLDACVEFIPAAGEAAELASNFEARITYNQSKERSAMARDRLADAIGQYREKWLNREAAARGVEPAAWEWFSMSERNLASAKQMGSFILGMLLPILFVVMVAVGCFYPAVDATAGERERNTWETLMSTAANRVSVATAKYLYVTTLGGLAGVLNMTAAVLTIKPVLAPLVQEANEFLSFTVPAAALPVLLAAAVLLAGFVSAGMMIFAAFARTFKEGQAMITPFYLVVLLPVMFVQGPGMHFSVPLAFVPMVNITLMVRSAVSGALPPLPIAITILVSLALIAACVRLAAFILQFEDVMMGSYSGGFHRFFRNRILRRGQRAPGIAGGCS